MELNDNIFLVFKGFIDAKNEQEASVFGSFIALASRRDVRFVSAMFSRSEMPKDTDWHEIVRIHSQKGSPNSRDPEDVKFEEKLTGFFFKSNVLHTVVKNRNTKAAEQAVSRFCMEEIGLRSVTFLDYADATDDDIKFIDAAAGRASESVDTPAHEKDAESAAGPSSTPANARPDEIFVRCEPILDPVVGVAMNEIQVGDRVYTKLPADSVFYKMLARGRRMFDGVVTAEVTGILVNELGTATISMKLSDSVSGIMKLSGKVKVKMAAPGEALGAPGGAARSGLGMQSMDIAVAIGAVIIIIVLIAAVYYLLGE